MDITLAVTDPVALLLQDKRSPATRRAYAADLRDFFGGEPTPEQVQAFVGAGQRPIAARLAAYKGELIARALSENTVNRRLAAVRSLLKMCYRLGLASTDGRGLVDSEKSTAYRDTRGISLDQLKQLVALPDATTLTGLRDVAMLRVLAENALRRAELCALDVEHFSASQRTLSIAAKGRGTQRVMVTLSRAAIVAVVNYLQASCHRFGPLFRNARGGRLSSDGLYKLVRAYGSRIGVDLSPHRIRHSCLTAALDATSGDVRAVQKLSRHKNLNVLLVYDDARRDMQGELSSRLSDLLGS